ncbi:DUF4429 domain-containing protein [Nonomuraea sp. MG754425]|uniref:DUF4429 domain-containing protein n=1 Tax=Nonomuraea sp. MG754425 TaxID=2570319 RepID=UPI001F1D4C0C|nr:DUF4429 domain-containing protein [Nonomuraea sp. MG754425]MCF6471884.1 DUF4429 domain-containing protein [Nonomuraea sp. MG754425]
MDELQGKTATWLLGEDKVIIQYSSRWRTHALLKVLARCEIPLPAIAAVDFTSLGKKGWRLQLRLREHADPYAAVGPMLAERAQPFLLTGEPDTELLADYHADQIRIAADAARNGDGERAPEEYALALVPPVPLHIRTSEGTAMFDGQAVRLEWSDDASSPKTRKRRMEYALADIQRIEWFPQKSMNDGYLRIVTWQRDPDAKPAKPGKDFACLLTENSARQDAWTLVMAATVTAHLWTAAPRAAGSRQAAIAQPSAEAEAAALSVYDRIRELGRLHKEGLLTDEEFTSKKAELLDRL